MTTNTDPKNPERPETLAERSARLEAEAAAFAAGKPAAASAPADEQISPYDDASGIESLLAGEQGAAIIAALQNELEAAKEQTVRALAEAENTRRRARKDAEDAGKYAITGFAKDMLDIADNLRRALESVPADLLESEPRLKNFVDGVEATERVLLRGFEKQGIAKIEPLDQPFNPHYHEVMFEAPVPGKPAGTVMQVLEPGYILHDRLLRPARVGVTKDDGSGSSHPGITVDTSA